MPRYTLSRALACATLLLALVAHAGAAATPATDAAKDAFREQALRQGQGPSAGPPRANATSFAGALRCMDRQFAAFGVRGVSVVLEDIPDSTRKVSAGGRDMFLSATSDMTRASRGIALIPWNPNSAQVAGRERLAQDASFTVQGSVTQFDESTLRQQRDGAICLGPLCIGAAESDAFSGLSLDLSLVENRSLTLVPGATTRNHVLIRRRGRGMDGDLTLKKFGLQYNFTFTSSEGTGQALRSLVELGTIELYGKLLKLPYWTCLGLDDRDPGVAAEIEDWWESLRSDTPALLAYLATQMRARGLYTGQADGQLERPLELAIRSYKLALGLQDDLNVDLDFFRRHLAADPAQVQRVAAGHLKALVAREPVAAAAAPAAAEPSAAVAAAAAVTPAAVAPAAVTPAAVTPAVTATASPAAAPATAAVRIAHRRGAGHVHERGESVEFDVHVGPSGFLYCFVLDDERTLTQIFPNPARPTAAVEAGARIAFPGTFGFRIVASRKGLAETVACLRSPRDLGLLALGTPRPALADLPALQREIARRAGGDADIGALDVLAR